ncbi:MAG: dihydroorotate dehydrogenase electron transfer subunit [Candidatus Omnitrophica bacterium]|nr:dihydroorotate dehydrogenase electron transfer subunit [Candidatus Omnitrophota bacterium]
MIYQTKARIQLNKEINTGYYLCVVKSNEIAKTALPGQFLNIRLTADGSPLLRRPFSIHKVNGRDLEVLYEVVGEGSRIFSQKKPGEYLDVIGPLGNGFSLPTTNDQPRLPLGTQGGQGPTTIIVAGGMGVAPLLYLAEKLAYSLGHMAYSKPLVLIGAKTKNQLLCGKEFKALGCQVKIATDDGSKGFKGRVTDLLKKILPQAISHKPLAIYSCGPRPMLKEICRISNQYDIPAQVSLEEHMACGFGACLGCAVNTIDGYKRVCKDGPVFEAANITWRE